MEISKPLQRLRLDQQSRYKGCVGTSKSLKRRHGDQLTVSPLQKLRRDGMTIKKAAYGVQTKESKGYWDPDPAAFKKNINELNAVALIRFSRINVVK